MIFEIWLENINKTKSASTLENLSPKVDDKESSFITEQALSQNVVCITDNSLRDTE